MRALSRRGFLTGAVAAAAASTLRAPRVHAQKKGGAIRFIPHADLKVVDPIAPTAYITRNHAYLIYDTLFGTDEQLAIKPQMVDKYASTNKGLKWSFTLRDGRLGRLEAGLAVRPVAERLRDRAAAAAQRDAWPAGARIDPGAVDVDQLVIALHQVGAVRTYRDLGRHRERPPRIGMRSTIARRAA